MVLYKFTMYAAENAGRVVEIGSKSIVRQLDKYLAEGRGVREGSMTAPERCK
jgi:hypothetical protein